MGNREKTWLMRFAQVLLLCAIVIFAAACGGTDAPSAETISPADAENAATETNQEETGETEEKEPELRTAEVFDLEKHKGKLTVRYFYMEGKEKTGDSILIVTPDDKTMLIDAGLKEGGQQVVKYLKNMGIDRLDVILNTHPHIDHLGGFPTIIQNFEIGEAYMINHPYPSSNSYNNFISAMKRKKITPVYLEEGDSFQLGEHIHIDVLNPAKGELPDAIQSYEARAINQFSMVFKLTYEDTSFLFTGDIYVERERELVKKYGDLLKADMVHAPHHGSNTSSSSEFVQAVSAKVAVMSTNKFESMKNMNRYEAYGASVYSQQLHGNILIISDGKELEVVTEKDWENPLK